jgi:hypothetical protein
MSNNLSFSKVYAFTLLHFYSLISTNPPQSSFFKGGGRLEQNYICSVTELICNLQFHELYKGMEIWQKRQIIRARLEK